MKWLRTIQGSYVNVEHLEVIQVSKIREKEGFYVIGINGDETRSHVLAGPLSSAEEATARLEQIVAEMRRS
jgi:hypothetical protein